ncbi:endonuclease III domain-containing protein [endosymbiont of unidentified scaly snail isolate Monju]|uniref:endonuclease III domain-containing protein n=1 Tax=endosymbiont of unidentified scaly snail isolate Monju TaxID=1248727 RepID=UPI0003891BEE|nr:endonuclease [endosymbiont of unidentified scaly snail isolate Monju]BAN69147.1 endonuclease III related protein [endosymbiont of unidentified scaly snail isolate Monju]
MPKTEDFAPSSGALIALYERLRAAHGAQDWWPADSPFEVVVGAVLTQNTAWTNVERAIAGLKGAGMLSCEAILAASHEELAERIRPAGYFNVKARRLRSLCAFLAGEGGLEALAGLPTTTLRPALLAVNGIGPETADDILLYALDRPVFVIDAYTRRLLVRHGLAKGTEDYETLRAGFERALPADVALFKEYHALIVEHAKQACRRRPRCDDCALVEACGRVGVT